MKDRVEEYLDELVRLDLNASEGPWAFRESDSGWFSYHYVLGRRGERICECGVSRNFGNQKLIAVYRNAVPVLVRALRYCYGEFKESGRGGEIEEFLLKKE